MTSADFEEFELPGPLVLERGDVARLLGLTPEGRATFERLHAQYTAQLRATLATLTDAPPGLRTCPTCGTEQAPRAEGGQLGVHYPTLADMRPCPGSWPTKAVRR